MSEYVVSYTTPVASGDAQVSAAGIFAAQAEATTAVRILTGHPVESIQITAVRDAHGTLLWEPES
ncbi:hypothetical protein R5R73_01310 [Salinicola sp. LHM]|uniref:hypothetical protein n=1 Tax=Salinicola sp. LHM TaxID=3065298 RepID=UPI002ACEFCD1|nr:hypothetical protein [Salinicola sp. LHM]WQH33365.1 hypothetical protein R5R73_01310 [Salinicola sp. LHM]